MTFDSISQFIENFIMTHPLFSTFIVLFSLGALRRGSGDNEDFQEIPFKLARGPLNTLEKVFESTGEIVFTDENETSHTNTETQDDSASNLAVMTTAKEASKLFNTIHSKATEFINRATQNLQHYEQKILRLFGSNDDLRTWRMMGAMFAFLLLIVFVIADLIQGINTVSIILPEAVENAPTFLKDNYYIAILVSSVVTLFTLGFILVDVIGITHFIPWHSLTTDASPIEESNGIVSLVDKYWFRLVVFVLSIVTLIFSVAIVTLLALTRVVPYGAKVPFLQQLSVDGIVLEHLIWSAGALSESLVFIPLLITTVLLFWGVMGVAVILWLLLKLIVMGLKAAKGLLIIIQKLVNIILPTNQALAMIVAIFFTSTIVLTGLLIGLLIQIAYETVVLFYDAIRLLYSIFYFVFAPIMIVKGWITKLVSAFTSRLELGY